MRAQLTNRDYEQLSAYIDGQLSPVERNKLEERLRTHSDLQAALDEMSRTRALLRSAPRRRAPRNFTLTPAMVGQQKQRRAGAWWNLFPVLSFTSAVATLALVATIVFQLMPAQLQAETTATQPQADQIANIVQQTMTAMQVTLPADQAPLLAAGDPSPESSRIMSTAEEPPAAPMEKQAAPTASPTTEPTAAAALAVPAMESTPTPSPAQPVAEATLVQDQTLQQDAAQTTPPVVAWGNSDPSPAGMGESGGGGQGGISGSLLGPPAAAADSGIEMGKGGGGGDGYSVPGQNIVIPQESVNAEDATTESQAEAAAPEEPAPAQANPQITGPGPILGVPSADEGGQIVERKAIRGQPGARQSVPEAAPQPGQDVDRSGASAPTSSPARRLLGLPVVLALQLLLALIAIVSGATAFIVRKRAK